MTSQDKATERLMAYDGEGTEVGYLTLDEAREQYAAAEIETADDGTRTITVGDHRCACDCQCGESAARREATTLVWLCDECADYSTTGDGEVICSREAVQQ